MYDVMPDMITTAKALGNGFPCAALLMQPRVTAALQMEGLGTTFGGGPMACAVIEAVIEAIESEGMMDNVRRVSQCIRERCTVGPVVGHQGAGFLHGLRLDRPARDVQKALLAKDILAGTSGDPQVLRLLPRLLLCLQLWLLVRLLLCLLLLLLPHLWLLLLQLLCTSVCLQLRLLVRLLPRMLPCLLMLRL